MAARPAEGPAALVLRPWKVGGREEEGIGKEIVEGGRERGREGAVERRREEEMGDGR